MTNSRFCGWVRLYSAKCRAICSRSAVLPGTFFAEHDRSGRIGRIAVDLVPGRMIRVAMQCSLNTGSVCGVFLGERIARDAVMFQKTELSSCGTH